MATVLITGGTGLIGTALSANLALQGYQVIIFTRNPDKHKVLPGSNISYAGWDPDIQTLDREAFAKADFLIHLAGTNVGEGRWTRKRKKEIVDSRVKTGELLVKSIKEVPNRIKAVISSSAIGYYGPDPQVPNPHPFVETDPPGAGFLSSVVQQWEAAIAPVKELGKRLVIFRTGIVLSKDGGAYPEFKKPLKFLLSTILGSGRQMVSWIHIQDLIRLYNDALESENMEGVYNAVSPQPVSNETLMHTIAEVNRRFYLTVRVPEIVLQKILGEMSVEVLKSTTVSSARLEEREFIFYFPGIKNAIQRLEAS